MYSPVWVYGIGFLAQALFSCRLIIQWILSERQQKVLTPSTFWWLSLAASFLLFVYGYLRQDFAIMLGQAITYYIYIRNLQLQNEWHRSPNILRLLFWICPFLLLVYSYFTGDFDPGILFSSSNIPFWLLLLGTVAHLIFTFRFIYQWVYSERRKISTLPLGFWLLSFAGGILILLYAVLRRDPVLFLGHLAGIFIYIRNMKMATGIDRL